MKKKIEVFTTLGPSSLNKKYLKFCNKNVDLLRLNMSHIEITKLLKIIKFVKKYSKVPICIDTEGAQIRTKVDKEKFYSKGQKIFLKRYKNLYPKNVFSLLKKGDILDIGFKGLQIIIQKIEKKDTFLTKVIKSGKFENNKGVHVVNRKIRLNYLTEKDYLAIKIAKKQKINHFALSFTNSVEDIDRFNKLLKNKVKIFKLETRAALNAISKILKKGKKFLIDRGDLSKEISIEMIPVAQIKILKMGKRMNKDIYVATNFLESMLENSYPTRGEINDIFSTLRLDAAGLVLAGETAIGKHPIATVNLLQKIIKVYKKNKNI